MWLDVNTFILIEIIPLILLRVDFCSCDLLHLLYIKIAFLQNQVNTAVN